MSAGGGTHPAAHRPRPDFLHRLLEPIWRIRDRLLASQRFQYRAARFPLTRPLARRRARKLFDLNAGFIYSQVLAACVSARVFECLAAAPRSAAELAPELGLPEAGCDRLLRAAVSLGLLQRAGSGRYRLGELGAVMLGSPSIAAMVEHHRPLYRDLAEPLALLRERTDTELSRFWPYARGSAGGLGDDRVGPYSELMAASQAMLAAHVLDACSLEGHRHLVDLAGGEGAFAQAALERWPELRATVVDLPQVAERAKARFSRAGLAERATALGTDLFSVELPDGCDLITLVRVLHDHDDEPVDGLLRHLRRTARPGTRLIIAEPMAETRGAEPIGDAYFGIYLWAMGSGRPRSRRELGERLEGAGWTAVRERRTAQPMLVRVLEARSPGAPAAGEGGRR